MASKRVLHLLWLPAIAFVLAACDPPVADEIIVVDTTVDTVDGDPNDGFCRDVNDRCSLRAAVMHANTDPDVTEIRLKEGLVYTLSLTGFGADETVGDLDLFERTYIRSPDGQATIDANGIDRVIEVHGGDFQFLEGVVITGGNPGFDEGGGIKAAHGLVGIEDSRITGNTAAGGGGISVEGGTLWTENVTVDNNSATAFGGGGITINANAHLFQTTISENDAAVGAAIVAFESADADIILSTIAGNTGSMTIFSSDGTLDFEASAVEAETGQPVCAGIGGFSYTSSGRNVTGDASCGLGASGDTVAPILVFDLADNGGPVPTQLPAANSPLIDKVPNGSGACSLPAPDDARGEPRPRDAGCEAGAVEVAAGDTPGSDCVGPKVTVLGPNKNLQYCPLLSFQGYAAQDMTGSDLTGSSLQGSTIPSAILLATNLTGVQMNGSTIGSIIAISDTTCPDGTNSDAPDGDGGTCENNYL